VGGPETGPRDTLRGPKEKGCKKSGWGFRRKGGAKGSAGGCLAHKEPQGRGLLKGRIGEKKDVLERENGKWRSAKK